MEFSIASKEKIKKLLMSFERKESAILPTLYLAQDEFGGLSGEAVECVARELGFLPAQIWQVASFYSMLRTKPRGKYHFGVCLNLTCWMMGGRKIYQRLKDKLGVEAGEVTADKKFSYDKVECLGACGTAPVAMVNFDCQENLDEKKVDALIEGLNKSG